MATTALSDSFGWRGGQAGVQHDVQELTGQLLDALDRSLAGTSGAGLVSHLFKFKTVSRVLCHTCGQLSVREEDQVGLPLPVADSNTLHAALAAMTRAEALTGANQNQYRCSSAACGGVKRDAARSYALASLPPLLLLNLNRYAWNAQLRSQSLGLSRPLCFSREVFCFSWLSNCPVSFPIPPCPFFQWRACQAKPCLRLSSGVGPGAVHERRPGPARR